MNKWYLLSWSIMLAFSVYDLATRDNYVFLRVFGVMLPITAIIYELAKNKNENRSNCG